MGLAGYCHRCPKVQPPPYSGACDCLYDDKNRVPIAERIKAHFCPLGRFPASDEEIEVRREDDRRAGPCCDPPAVE